MSSEPSALSLLSLEEFMAKSKKNENAQFVRKETFWLGTLLALAVGFFGGVMFAVLKSDTGAVPAAGRPQAQAPASPAAAPARSNMIASLEDETAKNPQNTQAWIQLGNEYFDSSQHEKSIWAYGKALELDPNNANVWTDMGIMHRRSGKPQEAIQAFDKAIAVDPKHEPSRLNKGIVLLHDLQDLDGAIASWEALLEINPIAMAPTGRSVDEMVQSMKKKGGQMGQGTTN
jgi:cytochrome c-type biogenesis protein CcmH/NrfG